MHATKMWGSGGTVPRFLILSTTCRHLINLMLWLLYHQCKNPWYPLHRRHHGLLSWSAPWNEIMIPSSFSLYSSHCHYSDRAIACLLYWSKIMLIKCYILVICELFIETLMIIINIFKV